MKYTVFTVMTPDLEPSELVQVLKEYGYDGVEWRCKQTPAEVLREAPSFWGNNRCTIAPDATEQELEAWLELTKAQGLEVTAVTPYLQCGDLASTERVLQIGAKLGASMIRLGVPGYDGNTPYGDLFERAVRYLNEAQDLCKQYGIKGLVETHHQTIAPSASLARRLVEGLDPDLVGVLFDPGNMVHEGYENHLMGLQLLGPYLGHVHVKNAIWEKDASGGWKARWWKAEEGIVDWPKVLRDLKTVGYDGTIGFEDFSGTYPTREALRRNIDYIKSIWEGEAS